MATKATGVTPVWRIAALSRVAMVLLMLTFDALVDDYDTSGRLSPDDGVSGKSSVSDEHLRSPSSPLCAAVEGLVTWDAVYFQRISEVGYEHEQTHAFFPLIPAVTRGVASASSALAGATSSDGGNGMKTHPPPRVARCARAASALLISNGAHVAAAVVLERLGTLVLEGDDDDDGVHRVARSAAVLFALNPASVFHSAPFYTESVFALAGFAGFYFLERGARFASESATSASVWNRNGAALCFALACAARSNGALNGLVLAHDFFARVLPSVAFGARGLEKNGLEKNKRRGKNAPGSLASYVLPLFAATFAFAARCATTLAPLFALQLYGYRTYCARALGAETPAWCGRWRPFPDVYAHVQSHYWNVGFLRYYEAKQIPNFLLAAPALAVSASAGRSWWTAFRGNTDARKRGENELRTNSARRRGGRRDGGGFPDENASLKRKRKISVDGSERDAWMLSPSVRPYLFKWAVMNVVALLVMHVQVTTRFLSVTPGIYWFLAKRGFAEAEREAAGERKRTFPSGKRRGVWRRAATLYSISFFMLGALLFPTFYPWT
jgi:phosphatidylinositol glycan class V